MKFNADIVEINLLVEYFDLWKLKIASSFKWVIVTNVKNPKTMRFLVTQL